MRKAFTPAEIAAVIAVFALDRLSKMAVVAWLKAKGSIELFGWLHLTYVENTGAAFGVMRGNNALLMVVSVLLVAGLVFFKRDMRRYGKWANAGAVLVLGGALGNLYDRVFLGKVIDFVDFRIWPVFNAADSCISTGIAMMMLGFWKEDKTEAEK
jgi:signal peptidase II